jgi:hypothetical protein
MVMVRASFEAVEQEPNRGNGELRAERSTVRRAQAEAEPNSAPLPITDYFSSGRAALYSLKRFALAQLLSQC